MLTSEQSNILTLLCTCQSENIALAEELAKGVNINILKLLKQAGFCELGIEISSHFQPKLLEGNFISRLYFPSLKNLKAIHYFPNLTHLDCSYHKTAKLKGIENLPQLTSFRCVQTNQKSLEALKSCTKLTELDCHYNKLTNLEGLENCTELLALTCSRNKLTHLKGLENCTQLQILDCHDNPLSDLSALYQLPKLQMLDVYKNPSLSEAEIARFRQYQPHCELRINIEAHLKPKPAFKK